ncbi:hypothetical protein V6N13_089991 [Hibiscus sabdariffa]
MYSGGVWLEDMRSSTSHGFVFQQIIKKGVDIHIETEHMWYAYFRRIAILVSNMEYEEDQSIEKMNCGGGCENASDVVVSKQAFCDSKSSIFKWV